MDSGISGKTYLVETVDPSLDGPVGNEPDGDSRRRVLHCFDHNHGSYESSYCDQFRDLRTAMVTSQLL